MFTLTDGGNSLKVAHGAFAPALAAAAFAAGPLHAEDYPTKPVLLVVPFAPGGGSEFRSRLVGNKLTKAWKQQVVVESRHPD
jgi:tripartite-type tricarboxylate transporter receptor subunit TctC